MSYPIVINSRADLAVLAADVLEFAYQHADDLSDLWDDAEILADVFAENYEQGDPRG